MRVLQTVSGRFMGGGQIVALDLKQGLSTDELCLELCSLGTGALPVTAVSEHVVRDYDGRYNRPWVLARAARSFRTILEARAPDIVHSHGWDASVIAALALVGRRGTPHLVHWHTTDNWLASSSWRRAARKVLTRTLLTPPRTTVVAVAAAVQRHLQRHLGWSQVEVLHNAVDTRKYAPREGRPAHDRFVIGCAARLNPTKGIGDLLDALPSIEAGERRLEVLIAGEGDQRATLEGRARASGWQERVRFCGFVTDMPAFYRDLDLFVLPSRSDEGMPLAILEAMAAGVPVVATRVGGVLEVVREGVDGFVVPPGDPEALAAAVTVALTGRRPLAEMGRNARARALADFSKERWIDRVRSIYVELLRERDPGRSEC